MNDLKRREFVSGILACAGISLLSAVPGSSFAAGIPAPLKTYTVQEIMDIILKEIPRAPFNKTVDTLKSGKPGQTATGIVTTMFPSIEIIHKTIAAKANFIIAHEPAFYNHTDDKQWVSPNETLRQKLALLEKNNIAVWRLHDYWHAYRPDGILKGVLDDLGWGQYKQGDDPVLLLPPQSLKTIIAALKQKLGISHLKVIGDPGQTCSKVVILPGASGGLGHVKWMEKEKPDLLICGELQEWETAEYVRDARALGSKTALVVLGHSVSEEPGMKWLADWLKPKLPGLEITHIPSNDPFSWY